MTAQRLGKPGWHLWRRCSGKHLPAQHALMRPAMYKVTFVPLRTALPAAATPRSPIPPVPLPGCVLPPFRKRHPPLTCRWLRRWRRSCSGTARRWTRSTRRRRRSSRARRAPSTRTSCCGATRSTSCRQCPRCLSCRSRRRCGECPAKRGRGGRGAGQWVGCWRAEASCAVAENGRGSGAGGGSGPRADGGGYGRSLRPRPCVTKGV